MISYFNMAIQNGGLGLHSYDKSIEFIWHFPTNTDNLLNIYQIWIDLKWFSDLIDLNRGDSMHNIHINHLKSVRIFYSLSKNWLHTEKEQSPRKQLLMLFLHFNLKISQTNSHTFCSNTQCSLSQKRLLPIGNLGIIFSSW